MWRIRRFPGWCRERLEVLGALREISGPYRRAIIGAVVLFLVAPTMVAFGVAQADTGTQVVAGLGARKQEVVRAGASVRELAIAMMETTDMRATYLYGDGKTGDSTNFGIFKQNWLMIRSCWPAWNGLSKNDFHRADVMNSNLVLDVRVLHSCEQKYGDKWIAGHRYGETGLNNPSLEVVQQYVRGIDAIQKWLESDPAHLSDDLRFWTTEAPPV